MPAKILCGVYSIHNNVSKKHYVGSSKNIAIRYRKGHLSALHRGNHTAYKLQFAWNKYGEQKFELLVLQICRISNLRKFEIKWIKKLDSFHNGYNSNELGSGPNEYTIQRIREANARPERIELARKVFTEYSRRSEVRKASSERMKALIASGVCSSKNPKTAAAISRGNKGKKRTPEQCRKLSLARKRYLKIPGTLEKLSKQMMGNKNSSNFSKATRKRLSEAAKGNKNFLGKKHTKETKRKISIAGKGRKLSFKWKKNIGKGVRRFHRMEKKK